MKLFEYEGEKVITIENLVMYSKSDKAYNTIKNNLPKWIGIDNYIKVPHPDSVKYGQKKYFNYARGINLYPVKYILRIVDDPRSYLNGVLDVDALKADISKGVIREISEEEANNNWRYETKKEKPVVTTEPKKESAVVPVKMPAVQTEEVDIPMQTMIAVDEVYAMIDRMSELYQQSNNELKDRVNELIDKVQSLTDELENRKMEPVEEKETQPSILILKDDASYEDWKRAVNRALDIIIKIKPEWTRNSILSNAYDRLRSQYGIVWEQEAKEFKADMGRGPVNTRELCWWIETNKKNYKNLLIGKLNTVYSECKREAARQATATA